MTLVIRPAELRDRDVIAQFNNLIAEETEDKSLDLSRLGLGVEALLANPALGRYFVAEIDGQVVGQIMHTFEWSDWRNGVFWWIQSVYVAPHARRGGVFSALFRHLESLARADDGVCGLRLYVEHGNDRAQQTYSHLGMHDAGYRVMEVDFTVP